jgi:ribosome maturation factor RimP
MLDVEDLLPSSYTLEVSSPGLDRPLRAAGDYRRFAGRQAKLVLRERVDGQTFFRGRLAGLEGDEVLIDGEDRQRHRIALANITRANLEVEF